MVWGVVVPHLCSSHQPHLHRHCTPGRAPWYCSAGESSWCCSARKLTPHSSYIVVGCGCASFLVVFFFFFDLLSLHSHWYYRQWWRLLSWDLIWNFFWHPLQKVSCAQVSLEAKGHCPIKYPYSSTTSSLASIVAEKSIYGSQTQTAGLQFNKKG